jgi:hypothetical protein
MVHSRASVASQSCQLTSKISFLLNHTSLPPYQLSEKSVCTRVALHQRRLVIHARHFFLRGGRVVGWYGTLQSERRVAKSSAHQQNTPLTKPYQPTTIPAFGKECLHARRAPPEAPCHPCQTLFSERWWYGMVVWYFSQTLFGARTRRPARRTSIHGLTPLLLPRKSPILCQLVLADSTNPLRSRQGLTRHDATSSPSRL